MARGRFAPSPTGPLHIGNLRTALLAWLFARSAGSEFLVRVEDLDPVASREEWVQAHLDDLSALGLGWDGPVVRQSSRERREAHEQALAQLSGAGLTYPCYCTRKEVLAAASAPHGPDGAYPGTCRRLSAAARAQREAEGRRPALRLAAPPALSVSVEDRLGGTFTGPVDDFVLRRADGVPAYNLAVVVDDAAQGIEEVVRGDDLLPTTPRQAHLIDLLGLPRPAWAHVPLVRNADGRRLAKRDGAVTLADRRARGESPAELIGRLGAGLGLGDGSPAEVSDLLPQFDPGRLSRDPWVFTP